MIIEKLGELVPCFRRVVVAPRTERNQQFVIFVKHHVSVHHGRNAESADRGQFDAVLFFDVRREIGITILNSQTNIVQCVRPDSVLVTVFPFMTARSNGRILFVHKNRLNARGTEFDAQCGLTVLDAFFYIFLHNNPQYLVSLYDTIINEIKGNINSIKQKFIFFFGIF